VRSGLCRDLLLVVLQRVELLFVDVLQQRLLFVVLQRVELLLVVLQRVELLLVVLQRVELLLVVLYRDELLLVVLYRDELLQQLLLGSEAQARPVRPQASVLLGLLRPGPDAGCRFVRSLLDGVLGCSRLWDLHAGLRRLSQWSVRWLGPVVHEPDVVAGGSRGQAGRCRSGRSGRSDPGSSLAGQPGPGPGRSDARSCSSDARSGRDDPADSPPGLLN